MKFLVVLACVAAVAFAAEVEEVSRSLNVQPDSYSYDFALNNGQSAQESGKLKDEDTIAVQGSFGFLTPEGENVQISYTADENGYQPQGSALPTPPPIPAQIAKALEYIAAHPPRE
uniref:Uncharacterized protein n=1 Tax=Megaselia scalaris TaxID=36166 RepID=T1GT19_MEGSC